MMIPAASIHHKSAVSKMQSTLQTIGLCNKETCLPTRMEAKKSKAASRFVMEAPTNLPSSITANPNRSAACALIQQHEDDDGDQIV